MGFLGRILNRVAALLRLVVLAGAIVSLVGGAFFALDRLLMPRPAKAAPGVMPDPGDDSAIQGRLSDIVSSVRLPRT